MKDSSVSCHTHILGSSCTYVTFFRRRDWKIVKDSIFLVFQFELREGKRRKMEQERREREERERVEREERERQEQLERIRQQEEEELRRRQEEEARKRREEREREKAEEVVVSAVAAGVSCYSIINSTTGKYCSVAFI